MLYKLVRKISCLHTLHLRSISTTSLHQQHRQTEIFRTALILEGKKGLCLKSTYYSLSSGSRSTQIWQSYDELRSYRKARQQTVHFPAELKAYETHNRSVISLSTCYRYKKSETRYIQTTGTMIRPNERSARNMYGCTLALLL
ncbi:unnamed protein product [Didymodactylos carnosus]|uniref:Uncharacterized protein n=1 Tax=Didymodactylos carnosus TaxID=1234261 RepID=A0A815RA84_9BILA|nr:unnamed protein product [Didymodactylos carnosus]CAF4340095.1 unnamed protein product [Didymodactylos carnosus]